MFTCINTKGLHTSTHLQGVPMASLWHVIITVIRNTINQIISIFNTIACWSLLQKNRLVPLVISQRTADLVSRIWLFWMIINIKICAFLSFIRIVKIQKISMTNETINWHSFKAFFISFGKWNVWFKNV